MFCTLKKRKKKRPTSTGDRERKRPRRKDRKGDWFHWLDVLGCLAARTRNIFKLWFLRLIFHTTSEHFISTGRPRKLLYLRREIRLHQWRPAPSPHPPSRPRNRDTTAENVDWHLIRIHHWPWENASLRRRKQTIKLQIEASRMANSAIWYAGM